MFSPEVDDGLPQLDAMRMGVDYRIKCTIRGFTTHLRPLTMGETTSIISSVSSYLNTVPKEQRTGIFESWVLSKETLKLASTSDEGKADGQLGEILLGKFTPDELQALWKQYQKGLEFCDPCLEEITEDKLRELVDVVKKNPLVLTELSFLEVVNVCQGLMREVSPEVK